MKNYAALHLFRAAQSGWSCGSEHSAPRCRSNASRSPPAAARCTRRLARRPPCPNTFCAPVAERRVGNGACSLAAGWRRTLPNVVFGGSTKIANARISFPSALSASLTSILIEKKCDESEIEPTVSASRTCKHMACQEQRGVRGLRDNGGAAAAAAAHLLTFICCEPTQRAARALGERHPLLHAVALKRLEQVLRLER